MSKSEDARERAGLGGMTPILPVRDLEASVGYYVNVLGFVIDWQRPGVLACASRGRCSILLVQGDRGNPSTWIWIGVDDAERLFTEFSAAGAHVRQPTADHNWAYEVQVEDLDGNVLRLGSDPLEGQPLGPSGDM